MAIAFNESFSVWTKTFTDPRLRAAIVDRVTVSRLPAPARCSETDKVLTVVDSSGVKPWEPLAESVKLSGFRGWCRVDTGCPRVRYPIGTSSTAGGRSRWWL